MRALSLTVLPLLALLGLGSALVACGGGADATSNDPSQAGVGAGGATAAGAAGASAGGTAAGASAGGATAAGAAGASAGYPSAGGAAGKAGGSGAAGGASCEGPAGKPGTKALLLDGADDHVAMGNVKALSLSTFTVEAWVRRDGAGKTMSTGVGGLHLVPIAGKGRGESDGTNVDCNYAFGFAGERLGVDFEDTDDGDNHPLVGATDVTRGEWHHVAATFDGKELRLYLDGALDGAVPAAAKPRADSVQHFGIGAGLDSTGAPSGAFHGAIDDVRVWSTARTAAEIKDGAWKTIGATTGLVAAWSFEAGDASDSVGAADGKLVGATTTSPGSPIDLGAPPVLSAGAPTGGAAVPAPTTTLSVTFTDADSAVFEPRFYVRAITDADDFTIVALPDTQYYTEEHNDWRKHFYAQTKWIVDNRAAYNIIGVIHNGDISDTGQKNESEWKVADQAMSALEDPKTTGLAEGIPFAMTIGNHDNKNLDGDSVTGNTAFFNKYFGINRFSARSYYGGHYGSKKNDENFVRFRAGDLDLVVVSYQYVADDTAYRQAAIKWGRSIFDAHPDAFGIVNSHGIIKGGAAWIDQGKALYDSVADARNVHLMTCGHVSDEERRTDTHAATGHKVTTMLADYQFLGKDSDPNDDVPKYEGGSGYLRIWEFSPKSGELTVRTYSPSLKKWQTDAASEFTLKVPLTGAGGAWTEVKGAAVSGQTATASASGLVAGGVYEWYATVGDCQHRAASPIHRFTVK
ncbi:MAG: metallophosphoesterase [Polyangiaceae bacterium]|nr:metallophosphoesterase [Polyangiaceae bacterium]